MKTSSEKLVHIYLVFLVFRWLMKGRKKTKSIKTDCWYWNNYNDKSSHSDSSEISTAFNCITHFEHWPGNSRCLFQPEAADECPALRPCHSGPLQSCQHFGWWRGGELSRCTYDRLELYPELPGQSAQRTNQKVNYSGSSCEIYLNCHL